MVFARESHRNEMVLDKLPHITDLQQELFSFTLPDEMIIFNNAQWDVLRNGKIFFFFNFKLFFSRKKRIRGKFYQTCIKLPCG